MKPAMAADTCDGEAGWAGWRCAFFCAVGLTHDGGLFGSAQPRLGGPGAAMQVRWPATPQRYARRGDARGPGDGGASVGEFTTLAPHGPGHVSGEGRIPKRTPVALSKHRRRSPPAPDSALQTPLAAPRTASVNACPSLLLHVAVTPAPLAPGSLPNSSQPALPTLPTPSASRRTARPRTLVSARPAPSQQTADVKPGRRASTTPARRSPRPPAPAEAEAHGIPAPI